MNRLIQLLLLAHMGTELDKLSYKLWMHYPNGMVVLPAQDLPMYKILEGYQDITRLTFVILNNEGRLL